MKKILSLLVAGCLLAGNVLAHGIWFEQRRGNFEIVYGENDREDAYAPEVISTAKAYNASGKAIGVKKIGLNDHVRLKPSQDPAILTAVLDGGQYAKMPNGKWIKQKVGNKVSDAAKNMRIFKYGLAILQPATKVPDLKELKMVIVPETDPTKLTAGSELSVRVLVDGKPAVGVEIMEDFRTGPEVASVKTDNKGRAKVKVRKAELNVIAASFALPTDNPGFDEYLMMSTLTFLAGQK